MSENEENLKIIEALKSKIKRLEKSQLETENLLEVKSRELYSLNQNLEALVHSRTAELLSARDEAVRANHVKSQFLSNMSHEIRTPLNGVMGYIEILKSSGLTFMQYDHVDKISQSATHLLRVIGDILEFSRIEQGEITTELSAISIEEILRESIDEFDSELQGKEVLIRMYLDPDLDKILLGDHKKIKQILFHLISNSIKFTQKGSISVSVNLKSEDSKNQVVEVQVRDTGVGISLQKMRSVFGAFEQGDLSDRKHFSGIGLGLSIVQKIVQSLGGTIKVQSEENIGSVFAFCLPLQKTKLESINPIINYGLNRQALKLLLVEDNIVNQQLALSLLKVRGFQSDLAKNGKEALDLVKDGAYDLILMDCQMPIMDGYEATEKIRELNSEVPIVALTANALYQNKDRCIKVGMDDFLEKPFNVNSLTEIIEKNIYNKKHKIAG